MLGPELDELDRWVGEAGGLCDTLMTAATPQAGAGTGGFCARPSSRDVGGGSVRRGGEGGRGGHRWVSTEVVGDGIFQYV